jgi:two-component system, sensor histidine kinase PdtaS
MNNSQAELGRLSPLPWQIARHKPQEQIQERPTSELRTSLAREAALQQQIKDISRRHSAQAEEFEHRLLNGVQMIASLLSVQSRTCSPEAAAQLTVAVNRIVAFGHAHRQLHQLDHRGQLDLKRHLECLCEILSKQLFSGSSAGAIAVEGTRCTIPTTLGRPLGFIVSELITNSAKHGKGNIVVRIQTPSSNNHLISVADDGPGLPAEFSLDDGKGLGMKIIQALVKEIDGKLLVLRGEGQPGAHFAISFQSPPFECAARLETLVDNPARAVLSRSTQVTPLERQKIPEPRWSAQ